MPLSLRAPRARPAGARGARRLRRPIRSPRGRRGRQLDTASGRGRESGTEGLFIGLAALEGTQRLHFSRLGALHAPLGGSLGLLANGGFSLCDESDCLFGVHEPIGRNGRKFLLRPDPSWLAAVEGSLEQAAAEALSRAFENAVSLDLTAQPESLSFIVKLDRDGKRATLRLRAVFDAQMAGAPPRLERTRVTWTWRFRPARVDSGS